MLILDAMTRLITKEPSLRMNAVDFQSSKFFDNILVSTMKYMENFAEKTRDDKGQFMKGLFRVLPQFPERVLFKKVNNPAANTLHSNPRLGLLFTYYFIILCTLDSSLLAG
jgi:SCY1-like protein 2